jgi:hypothetical protein
MTGELGTPTDADTRTGTETTASTEWENQAGNWIAWTRAPGLDSYWRYRPALFEFLPDPGRATIDLGCGEGRACLATWPTTATG